MNEETTTNVESQVSSLKSQEVETATTNSESQVSSLKSQEAEATPTKSLLDGEGEGQGATSSATTETKSLLDGDDEPTNSESQVSSLKSQEAETATEPPTAEQIDEWAKGIKALDMGDGVTWSDDLLKGMAPTLMTLSKEQQEAAIKKYAELQSANAKAIAENADNANKARVKLCEERFGADLRKVAGLARKAGERIFEKHPQIWTALKSTPEFANNPDVLECLAEIGRRFADDTGRVTPNDGGGSDRDAGDLLHRMYGRVKI